MFNFKKKSVITINGKTYTGTNLTVKDNKVYIDGKLHDVEEKTINITVNGNLDSLEVDVCEKVEVNGNVSKLSTMSGNVDVKGDSNKVETQSGNVEISGNVEGDINTMSGDVSTNQNHGKITTMSGSIKIKENKGPINF